MELIKVADIVQEYKIDGDTESTSLVLDRSITENSVVRIWLSGDFSEQTVGETYTLKINDTVIYSQQAATGQDAPVTVKDQADFLGEFTIPNELIGESSITITGITSSEVNNGNDPAARAWIEVWVLKEFANLEGWALLSVRAINQKKAASIINGSTLVKANVFRVRHASIGLQGTATARASVIKRVITSSRASGIGRVIINADAWRFKGIKANLRGKSELAYFTYWRDIHADMNRYLPPYYDSFDIAKYFKIAVASEFVRLNARIQDVLKQHSIETSTWGLDLRERLINPNGLSGTRQQRKERLQSILAAETFKLENIVNVVGIEVEATGNPHEYHIGVLITGVRGEPKNIEEIRAVIESIVPSHLNYTIRFSYLTWGEVKAAKLTWGQAGNYTAKELKEAYLIEVNK